MTYFCQPRANCSRTIPVASRHSDGVPSPDHAHWETVPPIPRYGFHYVGLRNRIGILSESYTTTTRSSNACSPRAVSSRRYGRSGRRCKDQLAKLLDDARTTTIRASPQDNDRVVLRSEPAPAGRPHQLLALGDEVKDANGVTARQPKVYEVLYMGGVRPKLSVNRCYAYLVPASLKAVVENLQRHGIAVEKLRQDVKLNVEVYRIDKFKKTPELKSTNRSNWKLQSARNPGPSQQEQSLSAVASLWGAWLRYCSNRNRKMAWRPGTSSTTSLRRARISPSCALLKDSSSIAPADPSTR